MTEPLIPTLPVDGAERSERVERHWATVAVIIIVLLAVMAVFAGVHEASLPQSRVETANPRTLHLGGEFIESNLGSTLEPDGSVTVRAIGQQYSFTPQCILVPRGHTNHVARHQCRRGAWFPHHRDRHQPHAGARLHLQHPRAL